jgi:hypothetical protein
LLLHLQNPIDYYASLKQKNYSKPWKWIPTAGEQQRIPMACSMRTFSPWEILASHLWIYFQAVCGG